MSLSVIERMWPLDFFPAKKPEKKDMAQLSKPHKYIREATNFLDSTKVVNQEIWRIDWVHHRFPKQLQTEYLADNIFEQSCNYERLFGKLLLIVIISGPNLTNGKGG